MKHLRRPVLLLVLLVIAVAMGFNGSSLSPIAIGGDDTDVARHVPSGPANPDPEATETAEPTQPSRLPPTEQPTVEPTAEPTRPPAPTPTPEPVETPRPDVPENTTGASIIIERGTSDDPQVALTFDAGEGAGYTEEILDFLAEHGLRASFGITGEWARAYPELVQRMVDEGHMLFNHSESHLSWTGVSTTGIPLTDDERLDELLGADAAVEEVTGYAMAPFWRPPYGDYDADGLALLAEHGYDYTLYWTCDSLAWSGTTPAEIAERCGPDAEGGGPGAIILMHVTQEADYLSLEELVAAYEAEGYEFVTMEEMIAD
jgi:peptidoglycan-N-acetylglucosamine deacetylase